MDEVDRIFDIEKIAKQVIGDRDLDRMTPSQRACIAVKLLPHIEKEKKRRRHAKSQWIVSARKNFAPGDKQPCQVCGMYAEIAHAHHVLPLDIQYKIRINQPLHEHVWLCPNHHAMVHRELDPMLDRLVKHKNDVWYQQPHINGEDPEYTKGVSEISALGIKAYTKYYNAIP